MTTSTAGPLSIVGLLVLTATSAAHADDEPTTVAGTLFTGGTLSLADARGWLGRADGGAVEVGVRSRATLAVDAGPDELRAEATVAAALAPAPDGDAIVKGSDGLHVDARWVHDVLAWFGPFVRTGARASLFRATDARDAPTAWRIERGPDRIETLVAEQLVLTDALHPVTLHQSLGVVIRPVRTTPIAIDLHAGIGGRETFADGQLAIHDDPATATVEVLQARDATQLGAVAGIAIAGALDGLPLLYRLRMDTSFPLVHTDVPPVIGDDGDRGPMDLATIDASGLVAFGLGRLASIDYEFDVIREPLVVDAIQFRNVLRVTVGVPVGGGDVSPPR